MEYRIGKLNITDAIILTLLVGIAFLSLAPIWYTFVISLSDSAKVTEVRLWPEGFNFLSYKKIVNDSAFFHSAGISLKRVLLGGALNFALTVLMAFPLAKESKVFPGRNVYMWFIVSTMLFHAGLIPWYMTIRTYGLIDSIWALVLPGAVPVFNLMLLMNFFRNIPKELNEAATIDGAGPWQILFRVYLPLAVPALATVTLFSVVGHWNSFFDGLVLMNHTENYPLQTYIQQLVVQISMDELNYTDVQDMGEVSNRTLNAAKIFVSMLPVLIVYPMLQRYFIHGIMLGSVKE